MKTGLPRGECAVEQRDESLLHNARIENCWWISGGYNPVEYQATVKCDLHFANGNPDEKFSTEGKFNMHRPEIWSWEPKGAIQEVISHSHINGVDVGGGIDKLTVLNGKFTSHIRSRFHGQAFNTQTFVGRIGNALKQFDAQGENYLDNGVEYGLGLLNYFLPTRIEVFPDVLTNELPFGDSPTAWCNGNTWHHSKFLIHIRFEPDGGIPVTIGIVKWHNDGDTHLDLYSPNLSNQDYVPQAKFVGIYQHPEEIV